MKKINTVLQGKMNYKLFLVFSIVLLSFVAASDTSAATHTLTLTSSGSQSINVSASSGTAISSDSINVATTCRYGYNFTLSTSVSNNNLYLNGDMSNNTSGTYFSPADGSTALNTATNTWGYYYNSNASTTPTSTSVFSPVPTLSSPATIRTPLTTPASSNINDNFKIYYGVNSAPSMSVGTYKMIPDTNNSNNDGTLVYTATVADTCTQYTVHYNPTGTNMGTSITGTGTVADQTMYEGVATNLTNSYFTGPTISGTTYYFTGWNTAQDGSGTAYTRGQSVTDLTTVGNTITLYAQWTDCPANSICYTANGSDIVGEMGDQTVSSSATSATLYAPNFKRDNYGFAAWNTKADGTGTNYGPNHELELTAGQYSTGGLRLYAKWVTSAGNMQNWTGCSSMSIGDVTALKDTRDNDVYAVAKLADGKCWMIENLRLDYDANINTTNTQSDNGSWGGVFNGLAEPEYANFNDTEPPEANSLYYSNVQSGTATIDIGTSTRPSYRMPRYNNNNNNNTNRFGSQSYDGDWYAYGNYYTWAAAIADTSNHSISNNQSVTTTSICPIGWRLPIGGDKNNGLNNDYWNLIVNGLNNGIKPANYDSISDPYYTGNTEGIDASIIIRYYPNNFVYSGGFEMSSIVGRGGYGFYWTSTWNSAFSYVMQFTNADVFPGVEAIPTFNGLSVRCIVDDTL